MSPVGEGFPENCFDFMTVDGEDREKVLILTVGIPWSGKSTWAMAQGFPVVSMDALMWSIYGVRPRMGDTLTFPTARIMVRSLFLAGYDRVIVDHPNVAARSRDRWLSDSWRVEYKVFKTPVETCIARARKDGRESIIPRIIRDAKHITYPTDALYKEKAIAKVSTVGSKKETPPYYTVGKDNRLHRTEFVDAVDRPRSYPIPEGCTLIKKFVSDIEIEGCFRHLRRSSTFKAGTVYSKGKSQVKDDFRRARAAGMPNKGPVFERLCGAAKFLGRVPVMDANPMAVTAYEKGDFHQWHRDAGHVFKYRTITSITELQTAIGSQFELRDSAETVYPIYLQPGDTIFFPSEMFHRVVTPKKGVRFSLAVQWHDESGVGQP